MDFFSIEMSALCKRHFLFPPTKVKNRVGRKVARIWINWMMTWCLYSPTYIHPNCESSRVIAPIGKCLQVKREIGGRSAMKDNPRGKLWGSLWQGKCSLSTKTKRKKEKSKMTVDWEIRCALFETIQLHLKLGPRGGKKTRRNNST